MVNENIKLTKEQVLNINLIGKFLALQDQLPKEVDMLILLGSSLTSHLKMVSELYHLNRIDKIMVVGGVGHSTKYLYDQVKLNNEFKSYLMPNLSEADIYVRLLTHYYHIPRASIIIENKSTNCGNNASYAYQIYKDLEMDLKTIVLVQDPTMQRRTFSSFMKEWKSSSIKFYNYAPYIPEVQLDSKNMVYFQKPLLAEWTIERYIELVMGEIPRLRDDANGYGPNGSDFILHVDIPNEVEVAYECLKKSLKVKDIRGY